MTPEDPVRLQEHLGRAADLLRPEVKMGGDRGRTIGPVSSLKAWEHVQAAIDLLAASPADEIPGERHVHDGRWCQRCVQEGIDRTNAFAPEMELVAASPADGAGGDEMTLADRARAVVAEWDQTIADGGLVTITLAEPIDALRAALEGASDGTCQSCPHPVHPAAEIVPGGTPSTCNACYCIGDQRTLAQKIAGDEARCIQCGRRYILAEGHVCEPSVRGHM